MSEVAKLANHLIQFASLRQMQEAYKIIYKEIKNGYIVKRDFSHLKVAGISRKSHGFKMRNILGNFSKYIRSYLAAIERDS